MEYVYACMYAYTCVYSMYVCMYVCMYLVCVGGVGFPRTKRGSVLLLRGFFFCTYEGGVWVPEQTLPVRFVRYRHLNRLFFFPLKNSMNF